MNSLHNSLNNFTRQIVLPVYNFSHVCHTNYEFVPKSKPLIATDLYDLQNFINNSNKMCVLTGAGISTESGIPDYRSEGVGLYARSNRRPVLYKDFCSHESIRKRYWARNYVGWPRFSSFKPNYTHMCLKELEDLGKVNCIITQNVDSLHLKAGSKNVIELHGTAFRVMCLGCDKKIHRADFQNILNELNPSMNTISTMIRPDGDVDLAQEQIEEFIIPPCANCGGILKPDIIFFGDNVPRQVVKNVKDNVEGSDSLLVLGTSLTTYSGYRIVLQAVDAERPIAIVNIGKSRADNHANIRVEGRCGEVLANVWPYCNKRANQNS